MSAEYDELAKMYATLLTAYTSLSHDHAADRLELELLRQIALAAEDFYDEVQLADYADEHWGVMRDLATLLAKWQHPDA